MNYIWMRFVTDGSVQNRGFSINYTTSQSHCGGILKDQATGIVQSPTDTEFYPHGADCAWIIRTDIGTIIRLTWLNFALEDSYQCMFDHVEVFDSEIRNNISSIGRYVTANYLN